MLFEQPVQRGTVNLWCGRPGGKAEQTGHRRRIPKLRLGEEIHGCVLPSAGATANWHMGVVTPAGHQLMRDREIFPPLAGIRGELPEQERRRRRR